MKLNSFTKVSLVTIAILLGAILLISNLKSHQANASPGSSFEYVQVWAMGYCLPGLPQESHIILFDSRNGDVWAYSDKAMVGRAEPSYLGKLKELGKPIMKK